MPMLNENTTMRKEGKLWLPSSLRCQLGGTPFGGEKKEGKGYPPGNESHILGGGNSNILYFHPENWGRFPI